MTAHAKLSASGAHRWATCPASVGMEEGKRDKTSVYAAEGTDAHDLAEQCLRNGTNADNYLNCMVGDTLVSPEMIDAVQFYLDYVRNQKGQLLVEQRVDFSPWVAEGFGTADAIVINGDTISVIDLKYGKGVRVDAEENLQAILYALGTLNDYSFIEEFGVFKLVIVQPRLDHVSEWEISTPYLKEFGKQLKEASELALSDNPPFNPGEKQCRFCKAKATCRALQDHSLQLAVKEFSDEGINELIDTDELSNTEIAKLLPNLDLLINWVKAVQAHAQEELERGREIPGYKLVEGRSIRKWLNQDEAETALRGSKLKVGEIFTKKLISPTQAEKLLGKNHPILDEHAIKPDGKPTIAKESDKRPALKSNVERDFAEAA